MRKSDLSGQKKHKICHIITLLELGGAQQNTLYCTRRHDREKYKVGLIAGSGGFLDTEARGLPDTDVFLLDSLRHPISPLRDIIALVRIAFLLKREGVSLVHTHSSKAGILGRWAAWLARVPVRIHTVHGWSFNDFHPPLKRRLFTLLERMTAPITQKLVTVSMADLRKGIDRKIASEDRYTVIHSGMNLEEFRQARCSDPASKKAELGLDASRPVVGMVACLKNQKAPLDFVEAAQKVSEKLPEVQFLLVGDGILRDRIERKILDDGLASRVKLPGWRRDVPEIMNAMDVVVLTSLWEGLPRVIPQAFCCGKPVVATAVDGSVEVVQDGKNGFLVPPGDVDAMANRIVTLVEDEDLRKTMSKEAAKTIDLESDFNQAVMLKNLEELYEQLLEERCIML